MFIFSFSFKPYVAVIGDIIGSKGIADRKAKQDRLTGLLERISNAYARDIHTTL